MYNQRYYKSSSQKSIVYDFFYTEQKTAVIRALIQYKDDILPV